jgi:hypothetical protein
MAEAKVFCIGFQKTGTTSIERALKLMGYRVCSTLGVHDPEIGEKALELAMAAVPNYDAFRDNPWPILFREMDAAFPGSKFILTTRSTRSWLRSVVGHFGDSTSPMRAWIYGVGAPKGNEAAFAARFEAHNQGVLQHFRDRSQDLLVMDLTRGDGWEELCAFLGRPIPEAPFPHANRTSLRRLKRALTRIREALGFRRKRAAL